MRYIVGALLISLAFIASPAKAQDALVVQTCGTLPLAYAPGATRLVTVDTTGKLCSSGGAVSPGVTTTTCGTTQVLFALAGFVSCDTGFTYAGASGVVAAIGTIQTSSNFSVPNGLGVTWPSDGSFIMTGNGVFVFRNSNGTNTATATVSGGVNGQFGLTGTIAATLATAVGADVVCNAGTATSPLTVQVSATGCAASSARFKEGIASLDRKKALEDVLRFEPISYFYKPEFEMGLDKHVGFTAEQIGSIDPQWITYEEDGVTPHAVKYNEMTALLAAAIQQLKADFEAYKRDHP